MKTFQLGYLNESSCIIRLLGWKSSNSLVTAKVKIIGPDGFMKPGKFEFHIANKTMLSKKWKAVVQDVIHAATTNANADETIKKATAAERFDNTSYYMCN